MNLPNYFFADLPPEAELTPVMIASACDSLRRNREKFLLPRSTDDIVKMLCEVGQGWLKPENQFRRLALERGPAETNFSRPTLERGLDGFFRQFTPENFQALLMQDLGDAKRLDQFVNGALARGPKFLVHIAAGNLPNPALMSLTLGLLARSAQFMKCATGGSFIPRLFAHSIYEADHKLGTCLEIAEWSGGNVDLVNVLLSEADCVTVTGEDKTLSAVQSRLSGKARFLGYGQRVSFGVITRESLREEGIAKLVSKTADDIVAWDQNGCLSPHCFYVEERGEVESDKFAALLAAELMQREASEPRGTITIDESAAIASRRAMYETLAAHRGDIKIWSSQGSTAWTVVFEHHLRFHFSPLNRFILVKPVSDATAIFEGIDELHGKVSTVGIAAPPEKMDDLARRFAHWGVTRICAVGQMQLPSLMWRHDGRPALGDLMMWTDFKE